MTQIKQLLKEKAKDTRKSRYNATWHGLRGSRAVLPHESMDEFVDFSKTIYDDLNPQGTYEHTIVKRLCERLWELDRACHLKAQISEHVQHRNTLESEVLTMERYETRIEQSIRRLRRELSQVQTLRRKGFLDKPPSQSKTKKVVPLYETEVYVGPIATYRPSEGEEAIDRLYNLARTKLQQLRGYRPVEEAHKWIEKQADLDLSLEDSDEGCKPFPLIHGDETTPSA